MAPRMPTIAVANHGDLNRSLLRVIQPLTGPGHARSRPELKKIRPYDSTMAMTALRMATTTARLTILYTVLFEVASMKDFIGTAEVASLAGDGAPTLVPARGTRAAANG